MFPKHFPIYRLNRSTHSTGLSVQGCGTPIPLLYSMPGLPGPRLVQHAEAPHMRWPQHEVPVKIYIWYLCIYIYICVYIYIYIWDHCTCPLIEALWYSSASFCTTGPRDTCQALLASEVERAEKNGSQAEDGLHPFLSLWMLYIFIFIYCMYCVYVHVYIYMYTYMHICTHSIYIYTVCISMFYLSIYIYRHEYISICLSACQELLAKAKQEIQSLEERVSRRGNPLGEMDMPSAPRISCQLMWSELNQYLLIMN